MAFCYSLPNDDGQQSYLLKDAAFDSVLELPKINRFDRPFMVDGVVPFSSRHSVDSRNFALSFFERDSKFWKVVLFPEKYVEEFAKFSFVISPDCSMYRDAPLISQLSNLFAARRVSYFWQSVGIDVLPLIRWGSEPTFTKSTFSTPPSFAGVVKGSSVCVSNYGCYKSRADKYYFRYGFRNMLDYLEPEQVLLYGSNDRVLSSMACSTGSTVYHFPDWISFVHRRVGIDG